MRTSRNSTPGSINSKVPGQKLLEVKGLTKVFTKGQGLVKSTILAVNNVSFSLQRDPG